MSSDKIKQDLVKLNLLLKDIYKCEIRLSDILKQENFTDAEVDLLQQNHIEIMLSNIDFAIKTKLSSFSQAERLPYILYHRYELFGAEFQTLETIGKKFDLSKERIRQLEKKALKRLKTVFFGRMVAISACQILNIDALERCLDHNCDAYDRNANNKNRDQANQVLFRLSETVSQEKILSDIPICLTDFVQAVNLYAVHGTPKLTYHKVKQFLLDAKLLEEVRSDGVKHTRVTAEALQIGIFQEERIGRRGSYRIILYNKDAQKFLLDHLDGQIWIYQKPNRRNQMAVRRNPMDEEDRTETYGEARADKRLVKS